MITADTYRKELNPQVEGRFLFKMGLEIEAFCYRLPIYRDKIDFEHYRGIAVWAIRKGRRIFNKKRLSSEEWDNYDKFCDNIVIPAYEECLERISRNKKLWFTTA